MLKEFKVKFVNYKYEFASFNEDDYDIILLRGKGGYAYEEWVVHKNNSSLAGKQMLLLADHNLSVFGGRIMGNTLLVYTD